nr:hypothetical protein CFP56_42095 [Quercus suber]
MKEGSNRVLSSFGTTASLRFYGLRSACESQMDLSRQVSEHEGNVPSRYICETAVSKAWLTLALAAGAKVLRTTLFVRQSGSCDRQVSKAGSVHKIVGAIGARLRATVSGEGDGIGAMQGRLGMVGSRLELNPDVA